MNLKEIEDFFLKHPSSYKRDHTQWLINRVKRLTETLENIAKPDTAYPEENLHGWLNAWRNITKQEARKALEAE